MRSRIKYSFTNNNYDKMFVYNYTKTIKSFILLKCGIILSYHMHLAVNAFKQLAINGQCSVSFSPSTKGQTEVENVKQL
jgi:hypothetical protein